MPDWVRTIEPQHFQEFRCLGADCEDTCCDGWAVAVDRPTFEKYQQHPDPRWRASFQNLVTINPAGVSDHDYARIQLSTTTCPFYSEGLCAIHKELGEEYLSVTCASFPRVWNVVDQVLERSLDLGCPEAARKALLDPARMTYDEARPGGDGVRTGRLSAIDVAGGARPGKPDRYFQLVRRFIIELLQNRALPLWKRLLIVGYFCDKVQELSVAGAEPRIAEMIQAYEEAVSSSLFEQTLDQLPAKLTIRIETVVELILARITSDFTNRRFLGCYQEFMQGLRWGPDSSMDDVCGSYQEAHSQYAGPFWSRHEHMLEHYLVNYVYRSLFPFGPQESAVGLHDPNSERSIHAEFTLLAVYFSIIETLLTGISGLHKEAFGAAQVIQVIYTFTRTFEHSVTFPQRVIQMLVEKGLDHPEGIAILVKT
jgi:lysine-N-methylase